MFQMFSRNMIINCFEYFILKIIRFKEMPLIEDHFTYLTNQSWTRLRASPYGCYG